MTRRTMVDTSPRRAFTRGLLVGCYTACWDCRFGFCNRRWHTTADPDDVYLWQIGDLQGPDPRLAQCGCQCQFYKPKPLIQRGGKP